jgi:HK97 family phage portal protein
VLSGVIASLPFEVYRFDAEASVKVLRHPIARVIGRSPHELYTKFDFMQTLIVHLYTFGNFYARIDREGNGRVNRLVILDPAKVKLDYNARGSLVYVFTNDQNGTNRYAADRVIHVSGMSWDGNLGEDLVKTFRRVLNTGLDNQNYLASFFANGASLSGVVSVPQKLDDSAYRRMRQSWNNSYSGANKAGSTAILEQGATYQKVSLSPVEAGAAEAKKIVISDVARITGVPQFLLEDLDRATFNNIEHIGQLFVTYTVLPICKNIEAEFSRKLLTDREQDDHEVRLDLSSLLRADTEARSKLIDSMMKWGIINRDEARKIEGINPIADGSGQAYYVPMNMVDPTQPVPADGQNIATSEADERMKFFDSIKSKMDAYGVAVRAGAITPQIEDEVKLREEAGLPPISDDIKRAWDEDEGYRRPITLKLKQEIEKLETQLQTTPDGSIQE